VEWEIHAQPCGLLGPFVVAACATAPNEGLDVTVSLDRTRLVRCETVTNTVSAWEGTLSGSSTCLTGYNVLDATGAVVAPGEVVCPADLVRRSVHGRPYVQQYTWSGYTGLGTSGTPLPAGTYRIVGGTGAAGRLSGSVSAPVSLQLVEQGP
jgi:hypothetical protein